MKHRWLLGWLLAALLVVLAACGDDNATPQGDPPILSGFESMPKQIVTLALTATPTPVVAGMAEVVVAQPSPSPAAPRPTATLTPYVGVFLGDTTSEEGEDVPTLAPYVINPVAGGAVVGVGVNNTAGGACGIPVAARFGNAYASVQARIGCPVNGGSSVIGMVTEPFERGNMFWRSDTRQIYALAANGQFWQVMDSWNDSIPASDPAFSPPGGMQQPVRGFGLVWRSNQAVRDALGWATLPEAQYDGFWQEFERGAMFVGNNSLIYALFSAEGQHSGPLAQ